MERNRLSFANHGGFRLSSTNRTPSEIKTNHANKTSLKRALSGCRFITYTKSCLAENMAKAGALILETGEIFQGLLLHGKPAAGEVVFNTSHSGYEEMATDPSYFSQILVMTAPMQGNYGASSEVWESEKIWIKGLVSLEMQSGGERNWAEKLKKFHIPVLSRADTRSLTLRLRSQGSTWGALTDLSDMEAAKDMIQEAKKQPKDWTQAVSVQKPVVYKGEKNPGCKIALIDFGFKKSLLKELLKRSSCVKVFPSTAAAEEIKMWGPDGVALSNGPGDPKDVIQGIQLTRALLGFRFLFGVCMGCQVLGLALGGKTYKLKFGHRGSNHPIKDLTTGRIYMSCQNHGYALEESSLPGDLQVSCKNLNDGSVAGVFSEKKGALAVQFHPESAPGPHEAKDLFDVFIEKAGRFRK